MTVRFKVIPVAAIVLPRVEYGSDWGVTRRLLARKTVRGKRVLDLFWWPGRMEWGGRGSARQYRPGSLVLQRAGEAFWTTLHEGGRLSREMLAAHATKIDTVFGVSVTVCLNPRFTTMVRC